MRASLHIAIYTGVFPNPSFIEHLISGIAPYHQVSVFGTKKGKVHYPHENVKVVETPTNPWRNVPLTLWRSVRLLVKAPKLLGMAFREAQRYRSRYEQWMRFSRFVPVLLVQPDIFHLQWASKLDRWMFLQQAYDCKVVVSLLGSNVSVLPELEPELQRQYLQHFPKVDYVHGICKSILETGARYGVRAEQSCVIPTLLSPEVDLLWRPYQKPEGLIKLVSVGRHHWVKGYRYALQAMALLKAEGIPIHYSIIAQGRVPEDLLFMVHDLGLTDVVDFQEALPQEALFEALRSYDLFLLPSLSEGIANVVLESMALGLPVISTAVGGMAEVVVHDHTGWLVAPGDAEGICGAVRSFRDATPEALAQMTKEALVCIRDRFAPQQVLEQYLELYDRVGHSNFR